MDLDKARAALTGERDELHRTLGTEVALGQGDREAELESETGDAADAAQPLEAEAVDDALTEGLRERLATVERALERVEAGTYGKSVQSGDVIPDARLEADPAAELTVEEAAAAERA